MSSTSLWERFRTHLVRYEELGFFMDISRMRFSDDFFASHSAAVDKAFAAMDALEKGAIANSDEGRMVGHYWLRSPELTPDPALRQAIDETNTKIAAFASKIHTEGKFTDLLIVGIGGSALGPQFIADALGTADDKLRIHFFDNTDPDGMDRVVADLGKNLVSTLVVVISKSGGTKETRNGMLEARAAFERAGLPFASNFVAVTGEGSELDKVAVAEGWLERFPMWDWVGGRTSVMSAVGLLPMALQGLDVPRYLAGAAAMDAKTRVHSLAKNAAMKLALMWLFAGNGRGAKDMVILPYKDRLMLFSKYLQQLVMESLGKELDLDGKVVNQGIAVYGNKGSTDQHAYVQQLRDGVNNFFATFIEVRQGRTTTPFEVEPGVTASDYLQGFLRGTRKALYENNRDSITLSVAEVNAFTVGALVALYERAVGFYATLVNVNAYHQPGVEAGKKAAAEVLKLQLAVTAALPSADSLESLAIEVNADIEAVFHVVHHLACNTTDSVLRSKAAAFVSAI